MSRKDTINHNALGPMSGENVPAVRNAVYPASPIFNIIGHPLLKVIFERAAFLGKGPLLLKINCFQATAKQNRRNDGNRGPKDLNQCSKGSVEGRLLTGNWPVGSGTKPLTTPEGQVGTLLLQLGRQAAEKNTTIFLSFPFNP